MFRGRKKESATRFAEVPRRVLIDRPSVHDKCLRTRSTRVVRHFRCDRRFTTCTPTWKNYIVADGRIVAQRVTRGSSVTLNYFVLDHLGSVVAITDSQSSTVVRQSYDPWGRMRNYADGGPDTSCALPAASPSTRGYTNQEQIPAVCLDNYNARLYDPQLGRFLAADPSDGSGLNRYWYVGDNPLSLNDPTGLCFLGCFWKSPTGKSVIGIAIAAFLSLVALPIAEEGYAVFAQQGLSGLTASQLALNAGIAGGVSGAVTTGKLEGAVEGAAEALAFNMVGTALGDSSKYSFFDAHTGMVFLAHGLVGGLFSAGQKGGFVSGFLAAGFGAAADSAEMAGHDPDAIVFNTVEHALAGGVGAMLGGGKFANGAVTGAFGYLFNRLPHQSSAEKEAEEDINRITALEGSLSDYGVSDDELSDMYADAESRAFEVYTAKELGLNLLTDGLGKVLEWLGVSKRSAETVDLAGHAAGNAREIAKELLGVSELQALTRREFISILQNRLDRANFENLESKGYYKRSDQNVAIFDYDRVFGQ